MLTRARDLSLPQPLCAILLSPWVDIYRDDDSSYQDNVCFDVFTPRNTNWAAKLYCPDPPEFFVDDELKIVDNHPSVIYKDVQGADLHVNESNFIVIEK